MLPELSGKVDLYLTISRVNATKAMDPMILSTRSSTSESHQFATGAGVSMQFPDPLIRTYPCQRPRMS